ncbi:MAG TPA: lyase family protein, partial [Thermovirgaceae bacterium]|nr:lyase family protein [Thermovirgaceae bacterium]
MIERYSTQEMDVIWSQENRFRTWLEVEIAACRAWMEEGVIPEESFLNILERSEIDVDRILQIEDSVNHDMIAFVSSVAEKVGPDGRYIHLGLTSSDVIDTSSSLLLARSLDLILGDLGEVAEIILEKAWKYRDLACVGRTHGVHAEPLSFGFKLLNWYEEIQRDITRLSASRVSVSVGKISGAVGTMPIARPRSRRGSVPFSVL